MFRSPVMSEEALAPHPDRCPVSSDVGRIVNKSPSWESLPDLHASLLLLLPLMLYTILTRFRPRHLLHLFLSATLPTSESFALQRKQVPKNQFSRLLETSSLLSPC